MGSDLPVNRIMHDISTKPRSINNPDRQNNTHFLSKDVDGSYPADFRYLSKRQHFLHLKQLNEGRKTGINNYCDSYITREITIHLAEAIASQLNLTPSEKELAVRYLVTLDREKLGLSSELVAYAVCAYVIEQSDRDKRRTHPNVPEEDRDDLSDEVASELGLNHSDIVKTYGKVSHRLSGRVDPIREEFANTNYTD